MMRARVGIDKTKSWADWVEEEDEAATQIVTPEDSKALRRWSKVEIASRKEIA